TFDEMPTFDEVQAERERAATRPPPDAESAEALILARRRGLERAARAPEQPPSIHAAHAQFGTDPSARAPAPAPVAPAGGGAAATLARELRARDAARRAVVLQEVLGPPAALRPPRLDGLE
ncbi:MAG TPA: hypothetical protein VFQ22_10755, partial [Longimicrobiales bacterium]|nr:hypothetical protein [Longimicrobiales bacterium]